MNTKREEQMDAMLDKYVTSNSKYDNVERTIAELVWSAYQAGWEDADRTPMDMSVPQSTVNLNRRKPKPQS